VSPSQKAPDDPEVLAERLRVTIGDLVRETRRVDEPSSRFAQVLGHLGRSGPLSQGELATRQGVRQQSMSATLAELAADGYVERRPDPDDGRRVLFALSPKGRAQLAAARRRRIARLSAAIDDRLSPTDRKTLAKAITLLERLAEPDD
jgi:DNA-binding MarR family transcriptional regulator